MRRAKPPLEAQEMFRSASRATDDTTRAQRGALRQPDELLASNRMGGGDPITSGDGGLGAFVPVTSTAPQARPSGKTHPHHGNRRSFAILASDLTRPRTMKKKAPHAPAPCRKPRRRGRALQFDWGPATALRAGTLLSAPSMCHMAGYDGLHMKGSCHDRMRRPRDPVSHGRLVPIRKDRLPPHTKDV
jgi:hypothetical protein